MNDAPLIVVIYVVAAVLLVNMYRSDYRAAHAGQSHPKALPGATACGLYGCIIAVVGVLLILALETGGEIALGLVEQQSQLMWYFFFAMIAAAVLEEVVFRGFLVQENKGRVALIASCVGFSLLFAVIHGHFWSTAEGWQWTFSIKASFTSGILFLNSLWFYAVRFGPWNPQGSIFPCMLAHAASNLGVYMIKLVQGYIVF